MRTVKLYRLLSRLVAARINCIKSGLEEWQFKNEDGINTLVESFMPSGSGFDNGTTLSLGKSNGNHLVFQTAYHHMNDGGMYVKWTSHTVTVRPSLVDGFVLSISGANYRDSKGYIYDMFQDSLSTLLTYDGAQWVRVTAK